MRLTSTAYFAGLLTVVSAHFQMQFPPPRGVFVEDEEPTFCDGYLTAASNRSEFPLTGGFISLNSEHPNWTFGVLISTAANPTSFNNFTQARNFSSASGEGLFCIPFDLSDIPGLTNGENVTIQSVFNGGDGTLYQCADLTLSNSFTIPSSVACTNASAASTSQTSASQTSSGSSPSSSGSSAPSPKPTSAASSVDARSVMSLAGLLAVVGAVLAV
ncbi:hypothetical protein EUX98_g7169 [Antrodiella citrinella]|uniref:Copper acquisition factor BIM1-like domain-containing protein n=1 Tax=Antrodiella citrinella TaxID=2447956 RepID=A0A4S4MNY1_9APHY|nr:hypothetical protein EUX98_g7169 [Antrodiella citrinella]